MNVDKVRQLIRLHPSISQQEIASNLGLDPATIRTIVNDFLHLGQINRRWTPTTLTAVQRTQRLDWSNFVLEKSKNPNRFIARFDTWIYKHDDHWTFDSNANLSNDKRAIACFYTITGIRAMTLMRDPRLLSSSDILDNCLGNNVKEKRFLYVDSSAYNSTRLLDCLHDRNVVLVALPECSADLMLGETFLEPTFWSNLQGRRFDTHDEGLKEYKDCIGKAVGSMGSKMFERWFERIRRCVKNEGDYVEQFNVNVDSNDCNASWRTVMEPNALVPSQVPPTPNINTNIATTDSCDEWEFKEPKLEPKEEFYYEDEPLPPEYSKSNDTEQPKIKLAIASNGGCRLVTGPFILASTMANVETQKVVPQQWTTGIQVDGLQNLGNNVQTRVVTRKQQRQAATSLENSVSEQNEASNVSAQNEVDGTGNLEKDRNVETQSDTQQQQQVSNTTEETSSEKEYPKPAYSYTCLCVLAIKNSRIGAAPVTAIYRFITEHFPYFRTAPNGWKNSVRHNLSHHKCFEKIDTATALQPNKRRNFWVVDPEKAEKMDQELRLKTKRHLENLREAMSHPENLDLLVRGELKSVTDFSEDTEDSSDEIEIHNEMVFASQLEASSASDDNSNVSQDDEIEIVDDDNKEALRVQLNLTSEYVPVPVAKRQKTLAGTMQSVYVYQPAKGRRTPLVYRADPLLEMI